MKEKKFFIDLIIFGGCPTILFCFYYNIFWCDAVYFLSVHLNLYENSISIFSNQRKKHPWWLIKHKVVVWLLKDKCVVKNNKLLLPFCFFYLGTMGSVTVQMTKWEWHMSPLLLEVHTIELLQNHCFLYLVYQSFLSVLLGWGLIFLGVVIIFPNHIFLKCVYSLIILSTLTLRLN